jgi:hypothetical protein
MRMLFCLAALALVSCGGGDDDSVKLTHDDYKAVERACAGHGGVASLLRVIESRGRSGAVLDVCLQARCGNGVIVTGPIRQE